MAGVLALPAAAVCANDNGGVVAKLEARACPAGSSSNTQCLEATVPENYDVPGGRKIGLDVVVVKAGTPTASKRALVILEGGPGQRASLDANYEPKVWKHEAQAEDIVLVDQRGTGTTPDFHCTDEYADWSTVLADLWWPEALARCAKRLSKQVDLNRYTTVDAARDLNAVRTALSYDQLDIVAYSYGTRVAQEYMHRYGQSVRAAILMAPESPSSHIPAGLAGDSESSLNAVLDRCSRDSACEQAYPQVRDDLARVKKRLSKGDVVLHQSVDGQTKDVKVSAGVVASYLRSKLYEVALAKSLPKTIHALAAGENEQEVLASIVWWRNQFREDSPPGLYMTVTCNEDIPFIDDKQERAAAAGTLIGSYRIDQQFAACRSWPHGRADAELHEPLTSAIPTLIVVGQFDPATPAARAEQMAAHLHNGKVVVVPNRSHADWDDDACVEQLTSAFFDRMDAKGLDASCVNGLQFPAFDLPQKPAA